MVRGFPCQDTLRKGGGGRSHGYTGTRLFNSIQFSELLGEGGGYLIYDQTKPGGKIRIRFISQYFQANITAFLLF